MEVLGHDEEVKPGSFSEYGMFDQDLGLPLLMAAEVCELGHGLPFYSGDEDEAWFRLILAGLEFSFVAFSFLGDVVFIPDGDRFPKRYSPTGGTWSLGVCGRYG
jgi:hypothetical protein